MSNIKMILMNEDVLSALHLSAVQHQVSNHAVVLNKNNCTPRLLQFIKSSQKLFIEMKYWHEY